MTHFITRFLVVYLFFGWAAYHCYCGIVLSIGHMSDSPFLFLVFALINLSSYVDIVIHPSILFTLSSKLSPYNNF